MATEGLPSGLGGSSLGEEGSWVTLSAMYDFSPKWSDIQEGSELSKSPTTTLLDIHYINKSRKQSELLVLTELRARGQARDEHRSKSRTSTTKARRVQMYGGTLIYKKSQWM